MRGRLERAHGLVQHCCTSVPVRGRLRKAAARERPAAQYYYQIVQYYCTLPKGLRQGRIRWWYCTGRRATQTTPIKVPPVPSSTVDVFHRFYQALFAWRSAFSATRIHAPLAFTGVLELPGTELADAPDILCSPWYGQPGQQIFQGGSCDGDAHTIHELTSLHELGIGSHTMRNDVQLAARRRKDTVERVPILNVRHPALRSVNAASRRSRLSGSVCGTISRSLGRLSDLP